MKDLNPGTLLIFTIGFLSIRIYINFPIIQVNMALDRRSKPSEIDVHEKETGLKGRQKNG